MKIKKFYVIISIQKYNSFENIIKLINLIDENVIKSENIFGTNYIIKWFRSLDTQYDYKCKIKLPNEQINLSNEQINNYIKIKFKLIENYIKFNYDNFGTDWSINFIINK
jgi:hypothetical protein